MNQQRRLSPAPSSPMQRNTVISQHSNRFQFLQVTPTTNQIQYVQLQNQYDQRQVSRERENHPIPQTLPKGFQSMRIMSQPDTSKSPVTPVVQSQPNIRPNSQNNQFQQYIDTALRNQREEMLKLFEQQNKQIEYMHQQQQLILSQQQKQQEKQENKKKDQIGEQQISQIRDQLSYSITLTCREMIHKLQKQEQTDFKALQVQIEKLKSQLYQMNLTTSRQSEKLQQSVRGKENETEEYQYKQQQQQNPQRNSLDNYDQYIKKYEQFNKQVNDYLVNRKIPEHLSSILNSSQDSNSQIQEVEFIQSDHPLTDITNVPNKITKKQQQLIQISQPFQKPPQHSQHSYQSQHSQQSQQQQQQQSQQLQQKQISPQKQNEDSPIKALNEQMMIDSLENICVNDPNNIQLTKQEFDFLKSQRMSTIHENDDEDEELIYQIDDHGFVLSQDGHPLIDEKGKRIQLSKQEIQFYRNKINSL